MERVVGEVRVAPPTQTTGHTNAASLARLVALGEELFREVRARGLRHDDAAGGAALLAELRARAPDFSHSFPTVLRWMVEAQEYDPGVFARYLRSIGAPVWKTRRDFLESQAEYLVLMHRHKNPRGSEGDVRRLREALVRKFVAEDDAFRKANETAAAMAGETRTAVASDRRARLRAIIAALRGADAAPGQAAAPSAADAAAALTATATVPADAAAPPRLDGDGNLAPAAGRP